MHWNCQVAASEECGPLLAKDCRGKVNAERQREGMLAPNLSLRLRKDSPPSFTSKQPHGSPTQST